MSVTRFCAVTGIPRATWYRWRAAGASSPGPWSTPAQDRVEADAKALAAAWESWGHRKLAELKRVGIDDVAAAPVSDSTMYRVLTRNGLCLPAKDTAAVRQAAGVRREAFVCPPGRRNRLWQGDFSEYETAARGRCNLGGVVDYWAKVNLACEVTVTKTTSDAIAVFEAALADIEALLGMTWVEDLTDPAIASELHALGACPRDQELSPVFHRRLIGGPVRRQRRHILISHRHDPSRPTAPSCGPSDHARYTNFPTVPASGTTAIALDNVASAEGQVRE